MRAFIVLCLVAAGCADKLGYNYKPVGHSDFGLSFTPSGSLGYVSGGFNGGVGHQGYDSSVAGGSGSAGPVGGFGVGGVSFNGGSNAGPAFGNSGVVGFGPVSNAGPAFGNSGVVGAGPGNFNGGVSHAPQAELEKEFYTFTANEQDFSTPHVENQIANSGKKGLRVIFIKGPESNGLENAAVSLAKHIAEQKTAIYVLQKQTDLGSLSHKLNTINSNINHKPEVHFVKYRTPEDAVNAQKAIQGQYDSLGGVSNNFNGGEAPVLNFASKAPLASPNTHGSGSSGSFGPSGSLGSVGSTGSSGSAGLSGLSSPSHSYIPPSAPSSTYLPA